VFSEHALIKYRVLVEVRWLQTLACTPGVAEVPPLSPEADAFLEALLAGFDHTFAEEVKAFEAVTNHDVKAVEYALKKCETALGPPVAHLPSGDSPHCPSWPPSPSLCTLAARARTSTMWHTR